MKVKPVVFKDGGEWEMFDLRKYGCGGLPFVTRLKYPSVCYGDVMHVHRGFVEIFLCVRGCARYETEDGEVQVLPGQVFLSRPDQPHRRLCSPKNLILYRAMFSVRSGSGRVLGLPPAETRFFVQAFMSAQSRVADAPKRAKAAFERLFDACGLGNGDAMAKRLAVKSAALDLLLSLAEATSGRYRHPVPPLSRVKELAGRIDANPAAEWPVGSIARELELSKVALNNAFKRLTGMTPHAYVLDARIRRARTDLERGFAVAAVAGKYRFPSASHFSTVFRKIVGCPPRECRRKAGVESPTPEL